MSTTFEEQKIKSKTLKQAFSLHVNIMLRLITFKIIHRATIHFKFLTVSFQFQFAQPLRLFTCGFDGIAGNGKAIQ